MKEEKKFDITECCMYDREYPQVNDLVMCKIVSIINDGAYVELMEYNNIQGLILNSDMSTKRMKRVKQIVKEGREEVLRAIRVDTNQGYIDLSKKSVKVDEVKEFHEFYGKSKQVHTIMKSLAIKLNITNLEDLYLKFGWKIYKSYEHAYDGFKEMIENPDEVCENAGINGDMKKALLEVLKIKMVPHPVKVRAEFKLTCYTKEGIDALKYALKQGESLSTENIQIKFSIIASPKYEASTLTIKKIEGLNLIKEAIKKVEAAIKSKSGNFEVTIKVSVLDVIVFKYMYVYIYTFILFILA